MPALFMIIKTYNILSFIFHIIGRALRVTGKYLSKAREILDP